MPTTSVGETLISDFKIVFVSGPLCSSCVKMFQEAASFITCFISSVPPGAAPFPKLWPKKKSLGCGSLIFNIRAFLYFLISRSIFKGSWWKQFFIRLEDGYQRVLLNLVQLDLIWGVCWLIADGWCICLAVCLTTTDWWGFFVNNFTPHLAFWLFIGLFLHIAVTIYL